MLHMLIAVCRFHITFTGKVYSSVSPTDLKIDWIWHLLLKIEAGVIYRSHFTIF